ncbi:SMP-30/gluconolactonase/LRE family protein [Microbacterium thalassium]|uniref:SMP-30/gluconolactonase/LRE family protein n=1 Tax=Microbacterium TaxID=33882 RepID=UPI00146C1ECF|nr:SMP-30/gluconolactonase/LRE family protein [Microbacterium thalassium]
MPTAEQRTDPVLTHGEGPAWFSDYGELRCVDMLAGDVVSLDAAGLLRRNHVGSVAAMVQPRRTGGAVLLLEHAVALTGSDPGEPSRIDEIVRLIDDPAVRLNEGACDPSGRLVCGSMAYDMRHGGGSVWRVTDRGDGRADVELLRSGVTISNGLAFSPDGDLAYYIDSTTHIIEVIDYAGGAFRSLGRLADLTQQPGMPDGMCIDAEGNLWVAMFGGGCVVGIDGEGSIVERIAVPASQVTSCAFGGDDGDELYITTSTVQDAGSPLAGAIFSARPGVRGAKGSRFGVAPD